MRKKHCLSGSLLDFYKLKEGHVFGLSWAPITHMIEREPLLWKKLTHTFDIRQVNLIDKVIEILKFNI